MSPRSPTSARICLIEDCTAEAKAYSLCWRHAGKLRRQGDPLKAGRHGGHNRGQGAEGEAPDPEPARVLRAALERQRLIGNRFAWAWPTALDPALWTAGRERAAWLEVFTEHRERWESAFYRRPEERQPFAALQPTLDAQPAWAAHARSAPVPRTTGSRHDGESQLERLEVPWCR